MFTMGNIVGLCVASFFLIVLASMLRRSAFVVGIITKLCVVSLINHGSKH
jgi:hypothetical protein